MDDLAKCLPAGRQENGSNSSDTEPIQEKNNLDNVVIKRAVTFDDHDEDATREAPLILNSRKMSNGNGNVKRSIPPTLKPVVDARLNSPEPSRCPNAAPGRKLCRIRRSGRHSKYVNRVKYKTSCSREKFLLMALETENNNLETFTELWKKVDREKKVEQKLRCRVNDEGSSDNADKPERKISSGSHVRLPLSHVSYSVILVEMLLAYQTRVKCGLGDNDSIYFPPIG
ncbi:unnamed protein product [Strongylus vulgaris]|uniref:Uncharacterized protein n=1 Tax=Strongylus vulgaris TaxID=40348 RepID=A0A3P7JUY8_STRVU|nr:unnamed protein product [Strongylus vulgaris]